MILLHIRKIKRERKLFLLIPKMTRKKNVLIHQPNKRRLLLLKMILKSKAMFLLLAGELNSQRRSIHQLKRLESLLNTLERLKEKFLK